MALRIAIGNDSRNVRIMPETRDRARNVARDMAREAREASQYTTTVVLLHVQLYM